MKAKDEDVQKLIDDIENLGGGYTVGYGSSNSNKPKRQLIIHKDGVTIPIAKVSLMLACRVNTMSNGVSRDDKELLELLVNFSVKI
ncbi:hypothetical protein [Marinilactibacillus psychrotolerans]|uniref:hypothetical protein n=1 Tax=Marinilactibacillus psychrotolerans TaxID=191770 RepID=UPI00388AA52F